MTEAGKPDQSEIRAALDMLAPDSIGRIERDGVECTLFDIADVSYYPHPGYPTERIRKLAEAKGGPPYFLQLSHTPADGNLEICIEGDSVEARLDIRGIQQEPYTIGFLGDFTVYDLPDEAVGSNSHIICGIDPGGAYGHVYTRDREGSDWSIHINKPSKNSSAQANPHS